MFKINPNPTFWATVQVTVPGQEKTVPVELEFKHLPRPAVRSFFENLEGKTDVEALSTLVMNWRGFDVEFNRENLGVFIDNYPTVAGEIFATFREQLLESRRKN